MVVRRVCIERLCVLIIAFFVLGNIAFAKDVTLKWDRNTEQDLIGYVLFYDNESHLENPGDKSPSGNAIYDGRDAHYPSPVFLTDAESGNTETLSGITVEGIWYPNSNPRIFVSGDSDPGSGVSRVQFKLENHNDDDDHYYTIRAYDTEGLVSSPSNEVGTRPYPPYDVYVSN